MNSDQEADATLTFSLKEVTDPLVLPESDQVLAQGRCSISVPSIAKPILEFQSRVTGHKTLREAQGSALWHLLYSVWMRREQLERTILTSHNESKPIHSHDHGTDQ